MHRYQWKRLHISQSIIDRVDQLGEKEKQAFISNNFKYRLGQNRNVNNDDDDDVSIESDAESEQDKSEVVDVITPQFYEIIDDINVIMTNNEEVETTGQAIGESNDDSFDYDEVVGNNEEDNSENNEQRETPDTINSNTDMSTIVRKDENNDTKPVKQ